MKIALCSTFVPFKYGGAHNIVIWLEKILRAAGHEVERVYIPQLDTPDLLFQQMAALRWIDLSSADRVICFRPQSHLIKHPHKIVWFIHHLRMFYDLWDTSYRSFPDDEKHREIKAALHATDTAALREAKAIFTNSKVVADRLKTFNNIESEVLYPPLFEAEKFHFTAMNDEIVYVSRVEDHKRQHLLVDALALTKTPVRLSILGASTNAGYVRSIKSKIARNKLKGRVEFDCTWVSDEKKIEKLSQCLAAAYIPIDEDSYGYPSLEACHSSKPILTTKDSGGVLELVHHGVNGLVSEPTAQGLADAMDQLYLDKAKTKKMGQNAHDSVTALDISWTHVLKRLLA
jgi:glycosyltransferase involved in cell wall biosynthesis